MTKRKYSGSTRYSKKRRITRTPFRRRKTYRGRTTRRAKWYPLPTKRLTKFVYHTTINLDSTTGVIKDYVFSANGLYDPDITGIGHQPYGFDQIMANYDHYTVTGSKMVVQCANSTGVPISFAIALRDSNASYTSIDPDVALEQPGIVSKLMATTGDSIVLSKGFSARGFFGKKHIIGGADYRGDAGTNPPEQAYYHIMSLPNYSSDDPLALICHVKLTYYAMMTEPKILTQS